MLISVKNIVSPLAFFSKNVCRALSTAAASKPKEDTIHINNCKINYLKVGSGPHNILFLPGGLGTIWSEAKPQVEGFNKEKFTLVVWDPPGYGQSRPPLKTFDKDFYEKDAEMSHEFMKALGIPKYSLMGFSDGGITALIHAAKYSAPVKKLVVWGTNSFILPSELETYKKIRDIKNWSKNIKEPLIEVYGEELLAKYWSNWVDAMEKICKEKDGDICTKLLKDIKCPTYVLYGEKDPLVDRVHVSHLHTNIEGSRIKLYPEGKHHIHLRYAEDFNQTVQEFLLKP